MRIDIIVATYNRLATTRRFLDLLLEQIRDLDHATRVVVFDDGSTDGTYEFVMSADPVVKVLRGDGGNFWAGSMRKGWEFAMASAPADVYILLNDDVLLDGDALKRFIGAYERLGRKGVVLVGTTMSSDRAGYSYGGRKELKAGAPATEFVLPDPIDFRCCDTGNANVMLVDRESVSKVGVLDGAFTHGIADYDYTLRARNAGISVLVAPGCYGICDDDHGDSWLGQREKLRKRLSYLHSPKGLAYKEYMTYIDRHYPAHHWSSKVKLWGKTLFPFLWQLKKRT